MSGADGSDAGGALAAAIVAAVARVPGLNGCVESGAALPASPCAVLDTGLVSDWSHKSGIGREIRFRLTLIDEGGGPARLRALAAPADAAVAASLDSLAGWQAVSLVLLRSNVAPAGARRWARANDYRVRMLAR